MNNQDLHQQLMEAFRAEAKERIESMFLNLTALEKTSQPENQQKILEVVYREAHSLKGAARSVNIPPIEALCQQMESVFSQIKEGAMGLSPELFDTFHLSVGAIEKFLASSEPEKVSIETSMEKLTQSLLTMKGGAADPVKAGPKKKDTAKAAYRETPAPEEFHPRKSDDSTEPLTKPAIFEPGPSMDEAETQKQAAPAPPPKAFGGDTVRISSKKLDSLLLKTEELISVKQILNQHLEQMKKISETMQLWKIHSQGALSKFKELNIAGSSQGGMNKFFELAESNHAQIKSISSTLRESTTSLEQNTRILGSMVDDLLEEVKNTSLLPFSSLFAILPRMVRDIAREQGKDIDIEISGGDIEIDKRILESLKDPIIHLIRNSVDHGIESKELRKQMNKPPWGTLRLSVTQPEGRKVEMDIADDGAGINIESIKRMAVKKGIIDSEYASSLDDKEAVGLIFQSGISTSPIITEISGRGLGMAIVKETIETLGGSIRIINKPKIGTEFHFTLPVTLATFRGILVSVSGHFFIVPNAHVDHILKISPDDIKTAENRTILSFNGSALSLVKLADVLGLQPRSDTTIKKRKTKAIFHPTLILTNGDIRIAFIVDEIINEQEVLVKNLGKQLRRIPNISGATILGTGKVVPILNIKDVIKTASGSAIRGITADSMTDQLPEQPKSVLVVEDSFTSRTLIKNILEASGYVVKTAIDGQDGYHQLKAQAFNAVVSDVQMPKMDGFELTQKIRADDDLADMPVILVTSLDSSSDREKGIDAGANAYIVKSSFDQSNLLEVLERII